MSEVLTTEKGDKLPIPFMFRLLVQVDKPKEKGLIQIPDSVKDKEVINAENATIIAIGKTAFKAYDNGACAGDLKPGDRVMFARHGGKTLDKYLIGGDDTYRIIQDEDIIAVWPE